MLRYKIYLQMFPANFSIVEHFAVSTRCNGLLIMATAMIPNRNSSIPSLVSLIVYMNIVIREEIEVRTASILCCERDMFLFLYERER